jgi:N-succinyl-L-ornithine transcarbamylase
VLTWAPHIKPLPQAVPNSFAEWMCKADVDFTIVQPKGYELCADFTQGAKISYNQDEALAGADFIYVKNWSAYEPYGNILGKNEEWMLTNEKLKATNDAKVMHCLPVRRNLELSDEILDGPNSIVVHEAGNRVWAAQAVLKQMLESL